MPKKIKILRLANNELWDIILKTEYELIAHEGIWYPFRRTIIYTPCDDNVSKVRVI